MMAENTQENIVAAPSVIYVPVNSFNRLSKTFLSITDQMNLGSPHSNLVDDAGWIVEDLLSDASAQEVFPEYFHPYIVSEDSCVISFALPNRSHHRYIRRGIYQLCRQIEHWNSAYGEKHAKSALFVKDDDAANRSCVMLSLGTVPREIFEILDYKEVQISNGKTVNQEGI